MGRTVVFGVAVFVLFVILVFVGVAVFVILGVAVFRTVFMFGAVFRAVPSARAGGTAS